MNPEVVLQICGELRVLPFFPNDEGSMNAIVRLCGSMCADEAQVRWLVDRMTSGIYTEWPGIAEMRGCFCHRFKPKDGINGYSTVYPDGMPPDPTAPPRQITAPAPKRLEPGEPMTADPELQAKLAPVLEKMSMPPAIPMRTRFAEILREVETPPRLRPEPEQPTNPSYKPVTREDIERAVEELHAKQRGSADAA